MEGAQVFLEIMGADKVRVLANEPIFAQLEERDVMLHLQ